MSVSSALEQDLNSHRMWTSATLLVALFCAAISLGCRSTQPLAIVPASTPRSAATTRDEGHHAQLASLPKPASYAAPAALVNEQSAVQPVERELVPPGDAAVLNQTVIASVESAPPDVALASSVSALPTAVPTPMATVAEHATQSDRAAKHATFELHIENVRMQSGAIKVAVFTDAATFLNPSAATQSFELSDTSALATMQLSTDKPCAIAVFQDIDGNGQLTKNRSGLPVEPYGFSNNVLIKRGPPKFSEAVVVAPTTSTEPTQLRIRLTESPFAPRK